VSTLAGPFGILPAIGLVVAWMVSLPLIAVRSTLFAQAIVVEGLGSAAGLRRSWRLTHGCFWRTFAILVVVFISRPWSARSSRSRSASSSRGEDGDPGARQPGDQRGHLGRGLAAQPDRAHPRLLRPPHPQGGLRHRDARRVAVSRWLPAAAVLLALLAGVAPRPAHAAASDAATYVRLVDSARADLEASPPDLAAARDAIVAAQRLARPPAACSGPSPPTSPAGHPTSPTR